MASTSSIRSEAVRLVASTYPAGGRLFDWAFTLLSAWLIGGVFLDGWAHNHGKVDDVFFTPWHAVLYSGALAIILCLSAAYARNLMRGYIWPRLLPDGYGLSLAGAVLFLTGGALDLLWHELFGTEVSLEALLSPTHLLLASSGILMIGGPLRAAANQLSPTTRGWRALGPLLITATLTLSMLSFFTQYGHPIAEPFAARGFVSHPSGFIRALGISAILLQSALLVGMIVLLTRRWSLPFGALTLLIALNSGLMSIFHDTYHLLPAALAGGLLADLLLRWLRPTAGRPAQLRLFAFAVPAASYGLYFAALWLTSGIEWTVHLWMGTIVLAGAVGLFVSFLVASPFDPHESIREPS
jgi:hypothetical protein